MPNQILQVDENMLETKLDRLVSEKVEQLLNAMLDAEADEITGACRRSYTLECKTNAARRALEGEPLARVARDAGCTPTSVYQWMRRYRSEGILGLMDRRNAPMPAEPMPAAGDDVEELRRQVEVLRLENAVMRETIDVLKADDPRLDPSMLTNRERTRVVDAIRGEFGLAACLKAVGLKRSTYYYERGAIAAGDRYAVLRARVAGLFEQGGRAWGYRTIHRMLRLDESDPIVVSEKVVRRIMREGAMRPVYLKRPKRWSSYAGEIGEAPANLVERDFHADAPNMLWVTDVTFSPVNDVCFTTRSTHLPRTLRMYSTRVPPAKGAVRHLRSSRLRRTAPCVAWPGRQPSRPAITSVRTTDEPTVMPSVRNLPGSGRRPACCRRRTYRRRWKPSSDHARR